MMMHWFWGAALVPLVLCMVLCCGPMLLAMLGPRRRHAENDAARSPVSAETSRAESDRI